MTTFNPRWDLSEMEISESTTDAALRVVERLTKEKADITAQWKTTIRLAQRTGASLRELAKAADVSPQTIANMTKD